jgi:glycerol-3-phosphate acyltransferase PlsY
MFGLGIVMLLTYCVGSLCSAVIVAHLCHLPDPRSQGSRNPGTTNILRIAGKKYAVIVLLADMLKGLLPVLFVKWTQFVPDYLGYIGLIAVLGHIYPVFLKFKGGKGVATVLGVLLGLNVWLGLIVIGTWLVVAWVTRYSSLAAILAIGLSPVYLWFLAPNVNWVLPVLGMSLLVLWQHQENMQRLWRGQESKIKLSSKTPKTHP